MSSLLCLLALAAAPPQPDGLADRLLPLVRAHKGKAAVGVRHLESGRTFLYRPDEVMPTASLIKVCVLIDAYLQADEGKVCLRDKLTLKDADKVPGSGILTNHFSPGASFPLVDAVHLMIAFSDNTATNLVLDRIGLKSTAETMEKLGYKDTKVHSKVFRRDTSVFPERSKQFGLGSTSAAEMVRLCEALWKKELVNREASEAMIKHLRACDDKDKFPRFLPAGTKLAFKTGSVDASKTAAGVIECGRGPVAVCVMTDKNEDKRWVTDNAGNRLCAEVARQVFEHFKKPGAGVKNGKD